MIYLSINQLRLNFRLNRHLAVRISPLLLTTHLVTQITERVDKFNMQPTRITWI